MTQEVLKLALEALEGYVNVVVSVNDPYEWTPKVADAGEPARKAITAIKEALAQPEQEPVAWAEFDGEGGYHFRAYENNEDYAEQWDKRNPNHVGWVKPLYDTPPQRTEQEPVKIVQYNCKCGRTMKFESVHGVVAPQRTWVGLTDEEIDVIDEATWDEDHKSWGIHDFARAIEAKLKEKNT